MLQRDGSPTGRRQERAASRLQGNGRNYWQKTIIEHIIDSGQLGSHLLLSDTFVSEGGYIPQAPVR